MSTPAPTIGSHFDTSLSKALLVHPKYVDETPSPIENLNLPLGLAYIASVLDGHDITVRAVDMEVERSTTVEDVAEIAASFAPELVGISLTTPAFTTTRRLIERVKEAHPETTVLVGGPHASALPEETLTLSGADLGVIGEGEQTVQDLLTQPGETPLDEIPGLCYTDATGETHVTERREYSEMSSLPGPLREPFPIEKYRTNVLHKKHLDSDVMSVLASRGCPYSCRFCFRSVWGRSFRRRDPGDVVETMRYLQSEYGADEITFTDLNFTVDPHWVRAFTSRVREEIDDLPWSCLTRADSVDRELLREMKSAGCWQVCFGVESGSQQVLDAMNKQESLDEIKAGVELANELGFNTRAYFMFGFPGETLDDAKQTIEFALELDPDTAGFFAFQPFPGTPVFEEHSLGFSEDAGYDITQADAKNKNLSQLTTDQISELITEAYDRFYHRPDFGDGRYHTPEDRRRYETFIEHKLD